ncbi:GMP synthase, partial [Terribacillus saccharophilus]|nr:GMP synthase [Terribacillus saccharophilus]
HFETTRESMEKLIVHDKDYLDDSAFVQSEEVMKAAVIPAENVDVLYRLLDYLVQTASEAV